MGEEIYLSNSSFHWTRMKESKRNRHYNSIKELYNNDASLWDRDHAPIESDHLVLPVMYDQCRQFPYTHAIDIGCGEGYFTRMLAANHAHIVGIDISEEMVCIARKKETEQKKGIEYKVGNMNDLSVFPSGAFDLVTASYSLHYLPIDDMQSVFEQIYRVLSSKGHFIFATLDPLARWIMESQRHPKNVMSYKQDEGKIFRERIERVDKKTLEVRYIHRTLSHLMNSLKRAGFSLDEMCEVELLSNSLYVHIIGDFQKK